MILHVYFLLIFLKLLRLFICFIVIFNLRIIIRICVQFVILLRMIFREMIVFFMNALTGKWVKLLIQIFNRSWVNLIEMLFRIGYIGFIRHHLKQICSWWVHLPIFEFQELLVFVLRVHHSELETLRLYELVLTQSLRFNQHLFQFLFFFVYIQIFSQSVIYNFFCAYWLSHYFPSHHFV